MPIKYWALQFKVISNEFLHINEVVAKASKRLHILRVLKRGGVPLANLLKGDFL